MKLPYQRKYNKETYLLRYFVNLSARFTAASGKPIDWVHLTPTTTTTTKSVLEILSRPVKK